MWQGIRPWTHAVVRLLNGTVLRDAEFGLSIYCDEFELKAIDALLMPIKTNTYLVNGHNYQDQRLRLYLPGNGGLLTAMAMMVAGYDGAKTVMPGIPKNGQWKLRYEGIKRVL